MIKKVKKFLLNHEPFKPMHMGTWIRFFYFKHYLGRRVDLGKVRNVLDAGCGRGYYANYLAEILPESSVVGYDIDRQLEWDIYQKPNLAFRQIDLNLLEDKNKYDLIVSVDSLEHIPNNKDIVKKFYEALTANGYFYLHIPCEANERYIFPRRLFKEIDDWTKTEHVGEQYLLGRWKEILNGLGFKILLARQTFTFWGKLAWELETILRLKNSKIANQANILLMPLYKAFAILDLFFPLGRGNNLLIMKKK